MRRFGNALSRLLSLSSNSSKASKSSTSGGSSPPDSSCLSRRKATSPFRRLLKRSKSHSPPKRSLDTTSPGSSSFQKLKSKSSTSVCQKKRHRRRHARHATSGHLEVSTLTPQQNRQRSNPELKSRRSRRRARPASFTVSSSTSTKDTISESSTEAMESSSVDHQVLKLLNEEKPRRRSKSFTFAPSVGEEESPSYASNSQELRHRHRNVAQNSKEAI